MTLLALKKFLRIETSHARGPGEKLVSTKTVDEVLGPGFVLSTSIGLTKAFTRKFLIAVTKEFSTENVMFVLVAEKFKANPTVALFDQIFNEFIPESAPRSINVSAKERLAVIAAKPAPGATMVSAAVFDPCVKELFKLFQADSFRRLTTLPFKDAFVLKPEEKVRFDAVITSLQTDYGITLL